MYPLKLVLLTSILFTAACAQSSKQPAQPDQPPAQAPLTVKPASDVSKPTPVSIKYIANMGVLVSGGGKQILIDAIHQLYKPTYLYPAEDVLKAMETAAPPYDKIDLVLITHNHIDHFHAESTMLHLKNNIRANLVAPAQIVNELAKLPDYSDVDSNVSSIPNSRSLRKTIEKGGIKITALDLKHINPQHSGIQNTGYLIEIGDKKILHVGDADLTDSNFAGFELPKINIDAAVVPVWFLNTVAGCEQIKKLMGAQNYIATHIPPDHKDDYVKTLSEICPGTKSFVDVGSTFEF